MDLVASPDQTADAVETRSTTVSFDEFYRSTSPRMLRLAVAIVVARPAAEDVVQDAYAKTYARFALLHDPEAYVRRAVLNTARGLFRRAKVRVAKTPLVAASAELVDAGEHDTMLSALDALPARQRAALILRFYDRCTEAEIAHALGCRPGTVKSLISRGLDNLRKVIEP